MATAPGLMLAALTNTWLANSWPISDLELFRMEGEGSGGAGDGGSGGGSEGEGGNEGEQRAQTVEELKAEVDKWKAQSRKHEDRAKANAAAAKERDDLKKSQMKDDEKALAEAKEAGKAEATQLLAPRLVAAEIKAEAAGRLEAKQIEALLDGLDGARFLTDQGEVDTDKVTKLIDGLAPEKPDTGNGYRRSDLGQGRREQGKPSAAEIGREQARKRFGDPANAAK